LHYECSALKGENVEEVFFTLSKSIIQRVEDNLIDTNNTKKSTVDLDLKIDNNDSNNSSRCQSC
jgi:hypothetical protein